MEEGGEVNPNEFGVAFFEVNPNEEKNDIIYNVKNNGQKINVLEKKEPYQNVECQDYVIFRNSYLIDWFFRNNDWKICSESCSVFLIKGEGPVERVINRKNAVLSALPEKYQYCLAVHGDGEDVPDGLETYGYGGGGTYWPQLMCLRYGGRLGRLAIDSRREAFDKVWMGIMENE